MKADNEYTNKMYWQFKEGRPIRIASGFRIWSPSDFDQPVRQADAEEIEYSFFDFGQTRVVDDELGEDDCLADCEVNNENSDI